MGDINIDLLKCSDHTKTSDYLDTIFTQGFIPLILKPTRITPHSSTLIDHIYTNTCEFNITSGIVISSVSDHLGIFSIIEHVNKTKVSDILHKPYRNYSLLNINKFNALLSQTDYTQIYMEDCPNKAYDAFMSIFRDIFERAFPIVYTKPARKYIKHSQWLTKGLLKSSILKSKLLKNKLKYPSEDNINKYKRYATLYNKLIRIAKSTHFHEQIQLAKTDMKRTWKILKNSLNISDQKNNLPSYFMHDNDMVTDKKDIAEQFNIFFSNIGLKISEDVPHTIIPYNEYLKDRNAHSIFLGPVTHQDIIDITLKFKSKTSIDFTNVSSKLMKATIHSTAHPLTHIINLSLENGIFPNEMKISKVIPVFKAGEKTLFTNYRPISILPAFSKIIEKIIANKMIYFFESTNVLYNHQYGFRPRHNTTHPIIHLLNQVAEENDKPLKNLTMSVFLDLSKAFDTISHKILITKLDYLGIRGTALNLLRNYLSDRKQYTEIYGEKSSFENIKCGVPQGSILGPLLFLVYINDIHRCTTLPMLCFADDTTISFSSNKIDILYETMNNELNKLNNWFNSNKLCLNVKKTKYIVFRPSSIHINLDNKYIHINNQPLDRIGITTNTKSFKFLGLHLDETLTWKFHINHLRKKLSYSNYIMNKVKNVLPKESLLILYHSLFHCHLNYGVEIWGACSNISTISILQKRAIRVINRARYNNHTEPLFRKNNILKVTDLHTLRALIFMHKLKSDKLPNSFKNMNFFIPHIRPTREIYLHMAQTKRSRTKYSASLPLHNFPKMWNNLSPQLQGLVSTMSFKRQVSNHLIGAYSISVICDNVRCRQCHQT